MTKTPARRGFLRLAGVSRGSRKSPPGEIGKNAVVGTGTPENPNDQGLADMAARAGEGPVTMLNLLRFAPEGGRARYAEYGAAVAPLLERAGGRVTYAGTAAPALLGDDSWDLVLLV